MAAIYKYLITIETIGQISTFHFILLQSLTQIPLFLSRHDEIIIYLRSIGTFICMIMWFWNAGLQNEANKINKIFFRFFINILF